jgi:hypothetical protein
LLEEGVLGLVRSGEKDDTTRMGCETLDNSRSSRRRNGPHEEDGRNTSQCSVEGFGHGEVAGDDFDVRRQRRRLRSMRESADRYARVY